MIDEQRQLLLPPLSGLEARRLGPADAEAMDTLHRLVLDGMADKDLFWVEIEPREMMATYQGDQGVVIGVFDGDALVAYGALRLADHNGPARGADLLLPSSALPQVAHLSSAMVLSAYRNRRLHRWLLNRRIEVAAKLGRRHLFSTASPKNHFSWSNMVRREIFVKRLFTVGGGLVRCLMHRDLSVNAHFEPGPTAICDLADFKRQRALLNDGWWARDKGQDADGRTCMVFGRPIEAPCP
jgi:GNAT superfamily N-acetyltransferase